MKTAIFITIGTRDISISSGIDGKEKLKEKIGLFKKDNQSYWLSSPKKDGKIINEAFGDFSPFVDFPIIKPALEDIIEMGESGIIDIVFLIYTDQERSLVTVKEKFIEKDTSYFAHIAEKKMKEVFGEKIKKIKKIPVTENVAFYDNMYEFFGNKFNSDSTIRSLARENAKVYVLPQGGIASINTTLLLRCAEHFSNINQLSKPEGFHTPVNSLFPQLFKRNFTKERIRQAIENFDYSVIPNYDYSSLINCLGAYAFKRVTFNFLHARKTLFQYNGMEEKYFISQMMNKTKEIENTEELRYKEWYIMSKINFYQNKYSDFLLKMFNLSENLLKPFAEEKLAGKIIFKAATKHKEWHELLSRQQNDLKDFLNNYEIEKGNPLQLTRPTRYAYKAIYDFYSSEEQVLEFNTKVYDNLEILTKLRNKVGHNLVGISKEDLDTTLEEVNSSTDEMIKHIDEYFKLSGFGDYDLINAKIFEHLQ
jgi:hypothetical protein